MPWSDPLALLLHAGVAAASGDRQAAGDLLNAAEAGFRAADMHLYAAASQRRRGEIVGGDDGLQLIQMADAWMLRQRIQDPARMTEMVAPGRWTLPG